MKEKAFEARETVDISAKGVQRLSLDLQMR